MTTTNNKPRLKKMVINDIVSMKNKEKNFGHYIL